MGFDLGNGGAQQRARGPGIRMRRKSLQKGPDIPFRQRGVAPCRVQLNKADQGQIAGIRVGKLIQEVVERTFAHALQNQTLNVLREVAPAVFCRFPHLSQGDVNGPKVIARSFVCQAQSILGLSPYCGVLSLLHRLRQNGNGPGRSGGIGIESA